MNALRERQSRIRCHEPLARFTSWRVGGPADRLFEPVDVDALASFLADLPAEEPVFWLGLGSNVLIRDGGVRGTVIRTQSLFGELRRPAAGRVYAGAGVPCAKLARFCARQGFAGAEFFAGIPGTVGGALAMNAGAWGGETWRHVVSVDTLDRAGGRHTREPDAYRIGYRTVEGPANEWYLGACFSFGESAAPKQLSARIRTLLAQRGEQQPTGVASGGSVFRNPPGDHAARLIEATGLKGMQVGGARVSEKHANFIINDGTATAGDIETLIGCVRDRVESEWGVRLIPEVRIVGEEQRP